MDYKNSVAGLASKLGYTKDELLRVVANAHQYYKPFHIVTTKLDEKGKKTSKTRHIDNPYKKLPLRNLQIAIKKRLLNPESRKIDESLKGGIKKRSMLDHLEPHIGKATVVCMDLSNCFPNISSQRVFGVWKNQLGYSEEIAKLLTSATTYRGYLPQGAPTSSMLCNFALNPMAIEIRELLDNNQISYTQYIDDICFSGDDLVTRRMISEIFHITHSYDQKINRSKTEIMDTKRKQRMMGIVVNVRTRVDDGYITKVAKRIYQETNTGFISKESRLSISGQMLHIRKFNEKASLRLEGILNERVVSVYDGEDQKSKGGQVKNCWQYRVGRSRRIKCSYLIS